MENDDKRAAELSRRALSVAEASEIKLLRYELNELRRESNNDRKRIIDLENEVKDFEGKLRVGKGIVIGVLIASGSLGIMVVDKLKDFIGLVR